MTINNIIDNKGFRAVNTPGDTTVTLDKGSVTETTAPKLGAAFVSGTTWTSASTPVLVCKGGDLNSAAATASLPPISTANVGKIFWLFATSGTLATSPFITSSNPINGGAWTRTLSPVSGSALNNASTAFNIVTCIAFSGATGFGWAMASGSAL